MARARGSSRCRKQIRDGNRPEQTSYVGTRSPGGLFELAIYRSNNQDDQHRNDRNCYNPICSHPSVLLAIPASITYLV